MTKAGERDWEKWRHQLIDAWAKDFRATMTALLEGGPEASTAEQSPEPLQECDSCLQLIGERDNAEEWADKLAGEIARYFKVEIGEHSNVNNPWAEAYEAVPEVRSVGESPALPDEIRFALAFLKHLENVQLEHKAATTDLASQDAYQNAANCLNLAHYEIKRASEGNPTCSYKQLTAPKRENV